MSILLRPIESKVFLTHRQPRVVVDGKSTEFISVNGGVPQGTVLGPILFFIMINYFTAVLSIPVKSTVTNSLAMQEMGNIQQ